MQSNTGAPRRPIVGRRAMLAGVGSGAAAMWAGSGWSMGSVLPDTLQRPLAELFALPEPKRPVDVPLAPRRVSHPSVASPESLSEWELFKRRFIAGEGRVVDTGNGGVSHTEGQGWGMLCAVAFDDPTTFDLLHNWTARTLRRRGDRLHSWRYVPNSPIPVSDPNNATDGDLFIASALWRAAWRWGRPDLEHAAQAIARDILALLVREVGSRTVLLPGAFGFETASLVTINPSYYVFPAMEEMAALAPSPVWARLIDDGTAMLTEGRFGKWQLPPDWLRMDRASGALAPHPNWPARFSYDAIRVPLWLAWSGQSPQTLQRSFSDYWALYQPAPPAWIDLNTNAQAHYPAPPGVLAIGRTAAALSQSGNKRPQSVQFPSIRASPDYYSAALTMLSRCAWQECWDM